MTARFQTARLMQVQADEWPRLLLAFGYFFCLLCGYYLLRPVRDAMGVAAGLDNMPWLFSLTFFSMLLLVPLFGWLSSHFSRRRIVPLAYALFIIQLVGFYALFQAMPRSSAAAGAFFVWLSVFNLFVVSVFWSLMVDLFRHGQSRRLFPVIAAGGTCGAIVGPWLAGRLAESTEVSVLLLISATLLLLATACALLLIQRSPRTATNFDQPLGGSVLAGVQLIAGSRYLQLICLFLWLYTTLATLLYFAQAQVVAEAFDSTAQRVYVFSRIDLAVNVLTVLLQLLITGKLIQRFGLGKTLALVPALLAGGFLLLAMSPVLVVVLSMQVVRRAGNYAVTRPAREVLFTVLGGEAKYKAKNVIDTLVYRGGDAIAGWLFAGLKGLGLGLSGIALVAVPLALLWSWVGIVLGRRQQQQEETENG